MAFDRSGHRLLGSGQPGRRSTDSAPAVRGVRRRPATALAGLGSTRRRSTDSAPAGPWFSVGARQPPCPGWGQPGRRSTDSGPARPWFSVGARLQAISRSGTMRPTDPYRDIEGGITPIPNWHGATPHQTYWCGVTPHQYGTGELDAAADARPRAELRVAADMDLAGGYEVIRVRFGDRDDAVGAAGDVHPPVVRLGGLAGVAAAHHSEIRRWYTTASRPPRKR